MKPSLPPPALPGVETLETRGRKWPPPLPIRGLGPHAVGWQSQWPLSLSCCHIAGTHLSRPLSAVDLIP